MAPMRMRRRDVRAMTDNQLRRALGELWVSWRLDDDDDGVWCDQWRLLANEMRRRCRREGAVHGREPSGRACTCCDCMEGASDALEEPGGAP